MTHPTPAQLREWEQRWRQIKAAASAQLRASYTPEQRRLLREISRIQRQIRLCQERRARPDSTLTGRRGPGEVIWPDEPPPAHE